MHTERFRDHGWGLPVRDYRVNSRINCHVFIAEHTCATIQDVNEDTSIDGFGSGGSYAPNEPFDDSRNHV